MNMKQVKPRLMNVSELGGVFERGLRSFGEILTDGDVLEGCPLLLPNEENGRSCFPDETSSCGAHMITLTTVSVRSQYEQIAFQTLALGEELLEGVTNEHKKTERRWVIKSREREFAKGVFGLALQRIDSEKLFVNLTLKEFNINDVHHIQPALSHTDNVPSFPESGYRGVREINSHNNIFIFHHEKSLSLKEVFDSASLVQDSALFAAHDLFQKKETAGNTKTAKNWIGTEHFRFFRKFRGHNSELLPP
jgi:hypothetical protein